MFSKVMSSNKQRFLLWVLILLAINLIFKTHGYSIHAWRHPLEIKEGGVLNIGPPRGIRGDDWIVNFTFWRMQERARAGTVNSLIGYGQDFSLSPFVFVKHWSSVFKPHLWGFGLNINLGMSWLWNFLSLGALLVIYFSFRVLLPNLGSSWICGFLAITFLFSNFFQFWSLVSVPSFVYAGIALLAFRGVFSNCFRHWATSSLLLVWTLGALGFVFYPPFQVPSIHLLLLGMALIAYSEFRKHPPQQFLFKLLIGVVTGLVAIAIFCLFLYEKQDVVRTMLSTVYPGRRETLGGGLSLIRIIQDSVFPFLVISDFSKLGGNICEAAGFLNFLPLLIFLNLAFRKKMPQPAGIVALVFTLYQLFIFGWWIFGIPSWLAKITGLNMVPSVRASGVLGVTNMVLLGTWFYSNQNDSLLNSVQRSWIKRGWLLFLVLIWIAIFCLSADFRGVPWPQKLASFILVTLVFFLGKKIIEGKLASFAKGFAALSVLLTFFFNPIVFGGGDSLMEASPLIQEIKKVEKKGPQGAWIAFDHLITGHAPLLAGSRSFSGVYLYPDFKLWKVLDPSEQYNQVWNRYAHVVFELDPAAKTPRISTPQGDVVIVTTALDSPALLQLPFSYVMVPISKADQIPKKLFREEARTRDWILAVRLQADQ